MSRTRSIKIRRGRKKANAFDLDITPLLDIITILLIFLIQNYNVSEIFVPKAIDLPQSKSQTVGTKGVRVQVSKSQIWVDDKEVVNTDTTEVAQLFDEGGRRIIPLYDQLVRIRQTIKQTEKFSPNAIPFSGVANLVVDKSLKYSYLKRVMYTCAAAGFKEFKFIVE